MASKTPKSNQTSSTSQASKALKTTATSKAATKKPVAKKAAAARGPAVAAEPPAPAKKAAKKTVARKAAATTAAAARPAAAKPAARAATTKAAAAKASTAKPAAKASAKKAAAEVEKIAAPPAAPAKAAPRKTSSRKAAIKDTAAASAAVAEAAAVSVPGDTGTAPVAAAVEQAAHETPAAPASSAPGPARASEPASARTPTMERTGERAAPDASIDTSPEASTEARAAESPKANTEANTEASTAASTDTRTEPTTAASTEASIAASAPAQPAHAAEAPAPASAAPASASEPAGEDDEARNVKAKDAPADGPAEAAEDKRPRVLRRAGAGKPARPAVKPSWATYPEPLQGLVDAGRRMLGIDNLRPGQAEALVHVMNRRDLLAVMPTGSGKSLLYQLPSLVLDGLTVVVSPLIALIKDQLDKMEERGVAVCRFDSTLTVKQRRDAEALVQAPGGKLVFVTPERISDPEFRAFLRTGAGGRGVALFVVDEAHCVSQWGHDFRPSYLTLRKAIDDLGRPPLLATTATAPPHVREDILHQLGMPEAAIVTTTFERPNLHFEVMALPSEEDKLKTLVTLLKKLPRPGVVYCATVKKVEELYESLTRHAIPVARYHGRMGKKDRDTEQERLMDAKDMVMIATNAFGLGVDKANIRYVLHYHVPGSLEAYAQEAGRGGRDGKPSRCVLMFSPDDVAIQEYFLTGTYPSRRQVRAVFKALQIWSPSDEAPPTIANLALSSHVGTQRTRTVLSLLKDEGFVVEREEGTFWLADDRPSDEVLSEKAKQYEARRIADRQRLDALLAYVKTPRCRNQVILEYLGEPESQPCGRCDNCQRSREAALAAADQASRLEAKATAELNQEWSADSHDREADEENKPRRVIRHRVIRIDEPAVEEQAAKPAADEVKAAKPAADEVRTRAAAEDGTAAPDDRSKRPSNGQMRLPLNEPARANGSPVSAAHVVPAATPVVTPAVAATIAGSAVAPAPAASADGASVPASTDGGPPWAAPAGAGAAPVAPAADEDGDSDEYDDDEYIDDEDGDEYIDDEEGDEDEYEDEEYEDEDEDDEEYEDEDDEEGDEDEEYEDEDDDDEEYEDEEGEDDEEYDDEDFELIEKTAAALAEEGIESDTEITILARKRVEKPRPQKAQDSAAQSDADSKRRRKRRRRRKKRSMLPPKSAFITPVLSKESEVPVGPSRGRRRKAGPVIEYVRGPMRINMTPVASATPNDVAPSRKKKKRRRRGDEPVYPGMAAAGNGASAPSAPPSDENGGRKRRRRRRRRKRAGGSMRPMQHEGPVTFFSTQWPAPDAGARDEGGRRRRRRKRRSRNGRPGSQGGRTEPPPSRPLPPPSGE